MKAIVPELPAHAPRSRGNAFTRWIARCVLRAGGWKVVGEWPDLPRMVIIAAPHSSAWDAVWGIAAKVAMGVHIDFMAKKEAFGGPIGWLLRRFGAFPVDRAAPAGIVAQVSGQIRAADRMWLVIAPEGTRRRVEKWKSGFWKIARSANVPVFCAWFDYVDKQIGLGPLIELSDDMEADMARARELFRSHRGKNRDVF